MEKFVEKKLRGDKWIWWIVILLSLFSALAVYSTTVSLAFKEQGNESYFFKHLGLLGLSILIMYIVHRWKYSVWAPLSTAMLFISVSLLIIAVLFGSDINDAKRWITLPFIELTIQPSDIAKLAIIIYMAKILSQKQHLIKNFGKAFIPVAAPLLIVCLIIVPEDLSTAFLLFVTGLILMFIGRVRFKYIATTVCAGLFLFMAYFTFADATGHGRIETWKNRFSSFKKDKIQNENDDIENYQIQKAKIAIANSGILMGVGPGKSEQRHFLPSAYSDFIYAIIIEEYGLMVGFLIMLLYLGLLYRCIRIFIKSPGAFGALLAVGLSLSLVIQAMMNMAVNVGLIPVTGLTLPLVSMGGTSLLFTSVSLGIILSVSRHIEKIEKREYIKKTMQSNINPAIA